MAMLVLRASPALAATPPANDDFDHATVISAPTFSDAVDLSTATTAPDDPFSCGNPSNTVWYSFTPPIDETVIANAGGPGFFALSAFTGARGALTKVACGGFPSPLQFSVSAGVTYHIMLGASFFPGTASFSLTATVPPANDDFDHATVIPNLPFTDIVDLTGTTPAADDPTACGGGRAGGKSVWYAFTPSVIETVFVSANGASPFLSVGAYRGSRGALTQVGCSSGPSAAGSFPVTPGTTYHVMVVDGSFGPFFGGSVTFQVSGALPPANDDFDHATVVPSVPFSVNGLDVSGATAAPDDPTACGGTGKSVWYSFTPTVSETFSADVAGSNYQTSVSVYDGPRGALNQVVCKSFSLFPAAGPARWSGTAGVTYHIMVADSGTSLPYPNPHDLLTLNITGGMSPANDDFDHATAISGLPFTDNLNTAFATTAPDDPPACWPTDNSVWYNITPARDGALSFDTTGSAYQAVVAAYTGSRGSLAPVACDTSGSHKTVWPATAGVTYHVMVAAIPINGGTGGALALHVTEILPPANDDISHATVITKLPFTVTEDTTAATAAPGDPTCGGSNGSSVWFSFTAPASGAVRLDANGSSYTTAVSAYTGPPGSLTQIACGIVSATPVPVTKGVTYTFMASAAFPQMGGNLVFSVTAIADLPATGACTKTYSGKLDGALVVRSGVVCLQGATLNGAVVVMPGGQLSASYSTIAGSVISHGAASMAICSSSIGGQLTVEGSTGPVLIGDGFDATGNCQGNKIAGGVQLGGSGAAANKSGVELGGNTISGQVMVNGNKPDPRTVLAPDDATVEIEANHIHAGLSCNDNTPPPVNDGLINTVDGSRRGQCAAL